MPLTHNDSTTEILKLKNEVFSNFFRKFDRKSHLGISKLDELAMGFGKSDKFKGKTLIFYIPSI